jgi:8-oxo-dGTP pyrophosphatase MutT (NUDIX family)
MRQRGFNPDRFWGAAGAGILFVCPADHTIMLALRSDAVEQPGTWGITGGSCKGEEFYSDEEGEELDEHAAWDCAVRETEEELGYFPEQYIITGHTVFTKGSFTYTTFIVEVSRNEKERMMELIELNWENDEIDWFVPKIAKKLDNLHFGVKFVLREAKM